MRSVSMICLVESDAFCVERRKASAAIEAPPWQPARRQRVGGEVSTLGASAYRVDEVASVLHVGLHARTAIFQALESPL